METNTNTVELTAEAKFVQAKTLLEYFISHLEWEANNDPSFVGYEKYIAPNVVDDPDNPGHKKLPDGTRRGNGASGARVQQWITKWEQFGASEDGVVCLNVVKHGAPNEKPNGCYLHWKETGAQIKTEWEQNHINKLYLCIYGEYCDLPSVMMYTLDELGLFDGQAPNENLKVFWDRFEALRNEWWALDDK